MHEELEKEFHILHLIYKRNINQHRVATWWRYLEMVHRNVRKILTRLITIESETKVKVKQALHSETVSIAVHLLKKVFRQAYFAFNTIIALGQFINLGLVLVGLLSALQGHLLKIEGVEKALNSTPKAKPKEQVEDVQDPDVDLGVAVEPAVSSIEQTAFVPPPPKHLSKPKKMKKLKKSKKSKNAIDDIFG